jgi:serine protease Do
VPDAMRNGFIAFALAFALLGCHRPPSPPDSTPQDAPPSHGSSSSFTPPSGSTVSPGDISLLEQINRENVRVIDSALPSLVRISARLAVDPRSLLSGNSLHPFEEFERRPTNSAQLNEVAYGSGVVIKKNGYIVTNSHVIEGAHNVEVQLEDHRVFPATVVASDSQVDVAILKIAADDLKPLPWGDSDKVRVGEQVFAIGNPFDLGDSASRGIISATGRTVPEPSASYEDFLQTDAAINPGNSGGALINIHGELIGINVEIASTTGADRGVGFALPSNLLRYDVSALLEGGHSAHGYLGVKLPSLIDEGVIAQLGLGTGEGALLAGIYPRSPAEKARLQLADFITEIDGHKVGSIFELQVIAAQLPVGKDAEVKYIRDGERRSTFLKVATAPDFLQHGVTLSPADDASSTLSILAADGSQNALSGLQVTDLNDKLRKQFQVDDWISSGVVVTGVQTDSIAETRGFEKGDVIEMVCVRRAAPEKLSSVRELSSVAAALKPDQGIALLVHRGPANRFIYLSPLK